MNILDLNVSGEDVGWALARNAKEFAYALVEMQMTAPGDLGRQIAKHLSADDPAKVASWLWELANQISLRPTVPT